MKVPLSTMKTMILNKYSQKTWVVFVQGSFSQGGLGPGGF